MLEQTTAEQFGHYLGADAEDAMAGFCRFAAAAAREIRPATASGGATCGA
jgi:hypothetical protein